MLAYDEETGEQGCKEVVRLFRNTTEEWYHIHVNGEDIKCTGGHPFYVVGLDKFLPARELKLYDKVLLSDGKCAIIDLIQVEALLEPETTYNFEVADFHTYYVGENGLLVHNKCGDYEIHTGDTKNYSVHNSRRAAYRAAKRDAGVVSQQPTKVGLAINRQGHVIPGKTYIFGDKQILWHSQGHIEYGMTRHFNYMGWHYFY